MPNWPHRQSKTRHFPNVQVVLPLLTTATAMLYPMHSLIHSHRTHFICRLAISSACAISAVITQAFEKQKRLPRMTLPKLTKVEKTGFRQF